MSWESLRSEIATIASGTLANMARKELGIPADRAGSYEFLETIRGQWLEHAERTHPLEQYRSWIESWFTFSAAYVGKVEAA